MYGRGQGVPQDYTEAYAWESLAARSGHKNAIKNRTAKYKAVVLGNQAK